MTLALRLVWLAALANLQSFRCRRIGAAIVFLFLLGAALELGQRVSPGRTCDWHDLLANVCGILAGVALVRRGAPSSWSSGPYSSAASSSAPCCPQPLQSWWTSVVCTSTIR
jgi:hypothetical protein